MVLAMWSARRTEQRAESVSENRMQRFASYQGVRESAHSARQRAEEWDQWHESHGSLFFCLGELSCS